MEQGVKLEFKATVYQVVVNDRGGFAHLDLKVDDQSAPTAWLVLGWLGKPLRLGLNCNLEGFNPVGVGATFEEMSVNQTAVTRLKLLVPLDRAPEILAIVKRGVDVTLEERQEN